MAIVIGNRKSRMSRPISAHCTVLAPVLRAVAFSCFTSLLIPDSTTHTVKDQEASHPTLTTANTTLTDEIAILKARERKRQKGAN